MKLSFYNINKKNGLIIKAFAITLIVLHNYLHWTTGLKENEMEFSSIYFWNFLQIIIETPTMFFNATFSFFGHFGVQLFVFLSGYGLVKKYKYVDITLQSYKSYILPILYKIYKLIILGIIFHIFLLVICVKIFNIIFSYESMTLGVLNNFMGVRDWIDFIVSTLLLYNNFSFDRVFLYVGPWWYISFVIQLYIIFPFLLNQIKKYGEKGFYFLFILSYIFIYLLLPVSEKVGFPLFANFIGHLPEFLLGIAIAYFKGWIFDWKIFLLAILVFIISNISKYFFPLSFASVTIIFLYILYLFNSMNFNTKFMSLIYSIGKVSMYMFIVNASIRKITILLFKGSPLFVFFSSIVHYGVVFIISYTLHLLFSRSLLKKNG